MQVNSTSKKIAAHLAFIWLFLAAASLAVMGSGRVEGTGEFLGKINLNKLKNKILKEKIHYILKKNTWVQAFHVTRLHAQLTHIAVDESI